MVWPNRGAWKDEPRGSDAVAGAREAPEYARPVYGPYAPYPQARSRILVDDGPAGRIFVRNDEELTPEHQLVGLKYIFQTICVGRGSSHAYSQDALIVGFIIVVFSRKTMMAFFAQNKLFFHPKFDLSVITVLSLGAYIAGWMLVPGMTPGQFVAFVDSPVFILTAPLTCYIWVGPAISKLPLKKMVWPIMFTGIVGNLFVWMDMTSMTGFILFSNYRNAATDFGIASQIGSVAIFGVAGEMVWALIANVILLRAPSELIYYLCSLESILTMIGNRLFDCIVLRRQLAKVNALNASKLDIVSIKVSENEADNADGNVIISSEEAFTSTGFYLFRVDKSKKQYVHKFDDKQALEVFKEKKRDGFDAGLPFKKPDPKLFDSALVNDVARDTLKSVVEEQKVSAVTIQIPNPPGDDPKLLAALFAEPTPVETPFKPVDSITYHGLVVIGVQIASWGSKGIAFLTILLLSSTYPATIWSTLYGTPAVPNLVGRFLAMLPVSMLAELACVLLERRILKLDYARSAKELVMVGISFKSYAYCVTLAMSVVGYYIMADTGVWLGNPGYLDGRKDWLGGVS
ncbi:hypothetical protein HK101_002519 [Irineochytrium annulatum]|nr:hypothetical protein HK101_002519 [Irineochytrium annulatum]